MIVSAAGGILWVYDEMLGQLSCVDPSTGKARARMRLPRRIFASSLGTVVDIGRHLYVATGSGLFEFRPSPVYRGLG